MTVLGIEKDVVIDFKNKQGQQVHLEGMRLHLGDTRNGVIGTAVDKPLFVNKEKECYELASKLEVGDSVKVFYNRFGTFESLAI